jgi:hypothetical protein
VFYGTFAVTAGDTVTATATESSTTSTATVSNGSKTWTFSQGGGTFTAEDLGYTEVNCGSTGCTPIPNSGVTHFTGATVNGQVIGKATKDLMVDQAGTTVMKTSKKSKKGSFTTKWVLSCGTSGSC